MWTPPQTDREYRIGCDVSEGIEIGTRDTDWSVAVVLDALTYEEQAILRTRIDPDLLAWKLSESGPLVQSGFGGYGIQQSWPRHSGNFYRRYTSIRICTMTRF